MEPLTDQQIRFAIASFSEYASIREDQGHDPVPMGQLGADIDHSELLHRLLRGVKPLDKAPPVLFSRPCYALAEGYQTEIVSLLTTTDRRVIVDQAREWKWDDQGAGILLHEPSGDKYQLIQSTDWKFWTSEDKFVQKTPFGDAPRIYLKKI